MSKHKLTLRITLISIWCHVKINIFTYSISPSSVVWKRTWIGSIFPTNESAWSVMVTGSQWPLRASPAASPSWNQTAFRACSCRGRNIGIPRKARQRHKRRAGGHNSRGFPPYLSPLPCTEEIRYLGISPKLGMSVCRDSEICQNLPGLVG